MIITYNLDYFNIKTANIARKSSDLEMATSQIKCHLDWWICYHSSNNQHLLKNLGKKNTTLLFLLLNLSDQSIKVKC